MREQSGDASEATAARSTPDSEPRPVVYFATNHGWASYHHFYQGLARSFSRTRPVLYVDPTLVVGRHRPPRLEKVGDRLWVLRARHPKGFNRRWLRPLRDRLLSRAVSKAIRSLQEFDGKLVVWTYTTDAAPFIRSMGNRAISVYWTGDEVVDPFERQLLEVVTQVFAVSPLAIEHKRGTVGDRIASMPMAIDPTPYERAASSRSTPVELAHLPRPWFGYGGAVGDRLDRSLLRGLAEATTGSVLLVGPVTSGAARANEEDPLPTNVHFIGHRDEDEAPEYIASLDVGLIPYELTRFNLGSNPTKTYQYLAAGIPVVATALPALRPLAPHVVLAESPAEFIAAALDLATTNSTGRLERQAVARAYTYDALITRVDRTLRGLTKR